MTKKFQIQISLYFDLIKTWDFREDLKVIVLHHPDDDSNSREEEDKDREDKDEEVDKDEEEEDNNKNNGNNFSVWHFTDTWRFCEDLKGVVFHHPTLMMTTRRRRIMRRRRRLRTLKHQ